MLSITHPSPHHNPRTRSVQCIVLHATASSSAASAIAWFRDPRSRVSAHYVVDKTGAVYVCVDETRVAWHAGVSQWRGLAVNNSLNPISIGVEIVNRNDGADPYPPKQLASALTLLANIAVRHNVPVEHICGHYECAPGRKTDPRGIDMDRIRQTVAKIIETAYA